MMHDTNSSEKNSCQAALEFLENSKRQAQEISQQRDHLFRLLDQAHDARELDRVRAEFVEIEKQANRLHQELMENLTPDSKKEFDAIVEQHNDLKAIYQAFLYSDFLKKIAFKKEEMDAEAILSSLDSSDRDFFDSFLKGVKALEPLADMVMLQKEIFQQSMQSCNSLVDFYAIEQTVRDHHDIIASMYSKHIKTNDNPRVKQAIEGYIQTNQRVANLLELFNFSRLMADDIMATRMRLAPKATLKK